MPGRVWIGITRLSPAVLSLTPGSFTASRRTRRGTVLLAMPVLELGTAGGPPDQEE